LYKALGGGWQVYKANPKQEKGPVVPPPVSLLTKS
jgi:hypothetical protein